MLKTVVQEGGSTLDIKMPRDGASVSAKALSDDNNYNASQNINQAEILADIKNKLKLEEGDERPSSAPTQARAKAEITPEIVEEPQRITEASTNDSMSCDNEHLEVTNFQRKHFCRNFTLMTLV